MWVLVLFYAQFVSAFLHSRANIPVHGHKSNLEIGSNRIKQSPLKDFLGKRDGSGSTFSMGAVGHESVPTPHQSRWTGVFKKPAVKIAVTAALVIMAAVAVKPLSASAAEALSTAVSAEEHLHLGQKIANQFRKTGLPDEVVLMIISAMPVVELRGGIPVGQWMGLPLLNVLALCVVGNLIPIIPLLAALKNKTIQKVMKPVLDRAAEKSKGLGSEKNRSLAVALFVGIPLPGTGAWTGAMGAFLLGMGFRESASAISAGVLLAGIIMSILVKAGKTGAIAATVAMIVTFGWKLIKGEKEEEK
eukprot:CAMPEP_0113943396 /NCGR_PEP_ID=MMETSP1339-20121228/23228_1 /TAXON_ID=94617 /ORGANISM="Fibrocapsa japonica" /LENGTH=302 /DNA_ID=CAMNT_0000948253 /DNA_START=101 /DNA_END=1009 /DNA_ORIENTATION=- /assembly_acc=CAM_ASM_000762